VSGPWFLAAVAVMAGIGTWLWLQADRALDRRRRRAQDRYDRTAQRRFARGRRALAPRPPRPRSVP
jgi:hypothetical protein